jgi:hypothetical protein
LPEIFWIKSEARFRRFQNSPAAQTVGSANLQLRLALLTKIFQWRLKEIYIGRQAVKKKTKVRVDLTTN